MCSWKRARVYSTVVSQQLHQQPLLRALILQVSTQLLFFSPSDKCCFVTHLCFPARLAVSNLHLPIQPPVAALLREASAILRIRSEWRGKGEGEGLGWETEKDTEGGKHKTC